MTLIVRTFVIFYLILAARLCRAFLCFVLLVSFVLSSSLAADVVFQSQQWESRVLVLTGFDDDPLYLEQYDALRDARDAMEEREVVIVHYEGELIQRVDSLSALPFEYRRLLRSARERRYIDRELETDSEMFSVVLIGLDGQVKQVWTEPVTAEEITSVIDAMSMRQREISSDPQ